MSLDFSIIQLVQSGDKKAFGELYEHYIKKIYDFIYYKTHHQQTAEDLTSLVFVKALEKINNFKIDEAASFQAWLYQIARNTVIDHYRTDKKQINIEDVWDLAQDENFELDLDTKMQLEEIKKHLGNLKSKQRDIVIMRVWQEMSYKEIAQIMGESEANCKMIFSRALAKLKEEMPLAVLLSFLLFK